MQSSAYFTRECSNTLTVCLLVNFGMGFEFTDDTLKQCYCENPCLCILNQLPVKTTVPVLSNEFSWLFNNFFNHSWMLNNIVKRLLGQTSICNIPIIVINIFKQFKFIFSGFLLNLNSSQTCMGTNRLERGTTNLDIDSYVFSHSAYAVL